MLVPACTKMQAAYLRAVVNWVSKLIYVWFGFALLYLPHFFFNQSDVRPKQIVSCRPWRELLLSASSLIASKCLLGLLWLVRVTIEFLKSPSLLISGSGGDMKRGFSCVDQNSLRDVKLNRGHFNTALSQWFLVYAIFHLYSLDPSVFTVYHTSPVFNWKAEKNSELWQVYLHRNGPWICL